MTNLLSDEPVFGAAAAAASGGPSQTSEAIASAEAAAAPKAVRKPKLKIAHKVPGRIRLKVPQGKAHPELLGVYQDIFSKVPGITSVKAKPDSGSVIIHYDIRQEQQIGAQFDRLCAPDPVPPPRPKPARPGDEIKDIADKIEAEAEFLAERSEFARATVDFFKSVDQELKASTGNAVDLKVLLVGGLAVYTFLEIGAGAATPMWVTLALFSLNHLAELQTQPAMARAAR
ncbi:HMA2 domain-containing protein [Segnochrobactrum spirostomi]|uniref:Uncharacterized protein n=1 Tax=Segnochrobactrum spirostomi TaxID=2608987 RepID=A0A6A7YBS9_9HYPH|nr:hypothetical protein [Segnochrobactrum spirostomi]MQT15428.1 hypothetical protein [Segnochrobactrum spirostomi]